MMFFGFVVYRFMMFYDLMTRRDEQVQKSMRVRFELPVKQVKASK